jgi:hypothetical protein
MCGAALEVEGCVAVKLHPRRRAELPLGKIDYLRQR